MKPAHVLRILVSFMNGDMFEAELLEGLEETEFERAKQSAFSIKRGLLERIEKADARAEAKKTT